MSSNGLGHSEETPTSVPTPAPVDELPSSLERVDLLEFKLSIEREQRLTLVFQSAQKELETARAERLRMTQQLAVKYAVSAEDSVDLASGVIRRA